MQAVRKPVWPTSCIRAAPRFQRSDLPDSHGLRGKRVDVVTRGEMLDKDVAVVVVEVEGQPRCRGHARTRRRRWNYRRASSSGRSGESRPVKRQNRAEPSKPRAALVQPTNHLTSYHRMISSITRCHSWPLSQRCCPLAQATTEPRPRGNAFTDNWLWILLGVLILVLVVGLIFMLKFLNLWIQAYMSRTPISLFALVGMQLRKVNPTVMVRGMISATQAGIELKTRELEAHYLAGGNVLNVVSALIAADRANLGLDFRQATAIDLAGRDVLEAVQTCVNPKVIDVPDPSKGSNKMAAMAKRTASRFWPVRGSRCARTSRRLVGGATEETIIARVGEGIVSTIGSSVTHKDVLENPDRISRGVLDKGLDAGTAFEILSIDIADVDIGDNIGARLEADQAEADKRVAQAAAEGRRAMAVAAEQERSAEVVENRAKVVLAEAEVPTAMAEAFRSGNLGILDYYRMKNVDSDTKMRTQIAAGEEMQVDEDVQRRRKIQRDE